MDPADLAVGALAVHRLTRLAVTDEVTAPLRDRITEWAEGDAYREARPRLAYFVACPWCVSIWAGAAWLALATVTPRAARAAGTVLAWSSVTGLLSSQE